MSQDFIAQLCPVDGDWFFSFEGVHGEPVHMPIAAWALHKDGRVIGMVGETVSEPEKPPTLEFAPPVSANASKDACECASETDSTMPRTLPLIIF